MANFKQAPELKFTGQKPEGQYYAIPQSLADIIFNKLGNSSAQLRIMMVLIGTKQGFKISEKWILDRTGLLHASYITARKALVKRGWLSHDEAEGITVNFDAILDEKNRGNTVLPQPGNTVLPQCSNTVLPITDKNKIKTTNNASSPNKLGEVSDRETPEAEEIGTINNPIEIDKGWLAERSNYLIKLNNGLFKYENKFYKIRG